MRGAEAATKAVRGGGGGSDERPRVRRRLAFVDLKTQASGRLLKKTQTGFLPLSSAGGVGGECQASEGARQITKTKSVQDGTPPTP